MSSPRPLRNLGPAGDEQRASEWSFIYHSHYLSQCITRITAWTTPLTLLLSPLPSLSLLMTPYADTQAHALTKAAQKMNWGLDLEGIMLRQTSDRKDKYNMISSICGIFFQKPTFIDAESRLMIGRGRVLWGNGWGRVVKRWKHPVMALSYPQISKSWGCNVKHGNWS